MHWKRMWVGLVCAIVLMLAPLASNAMMNQDPGMCDIMCGGDQICYINCLYGGGGGGGGGGTGGGGGRGSCAQCLQAAQNQYDAAILGCLAIIAICPPEDPLGLCEGMYEACTDQAEINFAMSYSLCWAPGICL